MNNYTFETVKLHTDMTYCNIDRAITALKKAKQSISKANPIGPIYLNIDASVYHDETDINVYLTFKREKTPVEVALCKRKEEDALKAKRLTYERLKKEFGDA